MVSLFCYNITKRNMIIVFSTFLLWAFAITHNSVSVALAKTSSSVWCNTNANGSKRCTFKNLCYNFHKNFIFILTNKSIISGLKNKDDFKTIYATSVVGHTALPLKISVVNENELGEVQFLSEDVFLLHRFKPDNIMHVIHDDILPLYTTYLDLCLGNVTHCVSAYSLYFTDNNILGPFTDWYEVFSDRMPIQLSQLNKSQTVCFSRAEVGLSTDSLFYQYGFFKPKWKNSFGQRTGNIINRFRDFIFKQFNIISNDNKSTDRMVFLARKLNRKIINANYMETTIKNIIKNEQNKSLEIFNMDICTNTTRDLLNIVVDSKYMLGMHGSGLVLALFLPFNSAVIELFPYSITKEHASHVYVMSKIPGIPFNYFFWENLYELNSFPHPEYSVMFGGLKHLTPKDQRNILNVSNNNFTYKCCNDPLFLSRMYQDTIVGDDFFDVFMAAIVNLNHNTAPANNYYEQWYFPSFVNNISCSKNTSGLFLEWLPPFNLINLHSDALYKIDLESSYQNISIITNSTSVHFKNVNSAKIWIMCIINNIEGLDSYLIC